MLQKLLEACTLDEDSLNFKSLLKFTYIHILYIYIYIYIYIHVGSVRNGLTAVIQIYIFITFDAVELTSVTGVRVNWFFRNTNEH